MWLNMWFHANLCMSKPKPFSYQNKSGERKKKWAKILKTKQKQKQNKKSGYENNIMKLRQQVFPIFFHTL